MTIANEPTLNFADLLQFVASTVPDRTALICGDERINFAELSTRSEALAAYLHTKGLVAGQTIALHSGNRPEYLIGFFAACRLGCLPFNVNYRYLEAELEYLYGNASAAAAVIEPEWLPREINILLHENKRLRKKIKSIAQTKFRNSILKCSNLFVFFF